MGSDAMITAVASLLEAPDAHRSLAPVFYFLYLFARFHSCAILRIRFGDEDVESRVETLVS